MEKNEYQNQSQYEQKHPSGEFPEMKYFFSHAPFHLEDQINTELKQQITI